MTAYLYVLAIGPVQDFIAAARRTRDLWFGSHLLSEISKAGAKKIAESGGTLIFPAPENGLEDLKPSDEPDAFNVANIILAEFEVHNNDEITNSDRDAKNAAHKRWLDYAKGAREKIDDAVPGAIRDAIWEEQVKDVIEFYSAWVPKGDHYQQNRMRLMHLLAGRKSIRNFSQAKPFPKIQKSSLDGARESVLIRESFPKDVALRLRLTKGEELCAVGLTKRLGGQKVPFPSVVRVALDPWIRGIKKFGGEPDQILGEIGRLCDGDNTYASGTGKRKKTIQIYPNFPFDGQIFYPARLQRLKEDIQDILKESPNLNSLRTDLNNLNQIENKVRQLQKHVGEPNPYLAVLIADGDGMGKTISTRNSADEHRAFSSQLTTFAGEARNIVESKDYSGCMVYSGGDDVLAFLPVDTCIQAARTLHDTFAKILNQYPDEKGNPPTLSVGIAIGHSLDPLEDLLNYARDAEHDAKEPDRNGLALHLHTRGGGDPIKIREQWKDKDDKNSLDKRLENWVDMHRDERLPDRAAYDLLKMADDYKGWKGIPHELLVKDVKRLLKRKRAGLGTKPIEEADVKSLMNGIITYDGVCRRADELIVARHIAVIKKQAMGLDGSEAES